MICRFFHLAQAKLGFRWKGGELIERKPAGVATEPRLGHTGGTVGLVRRGSLTALEGFIGQQLNRLPIAAETTSGSARPALPGQCPFPRANGLLCLEKTVFRAVFPSQLSRDMLRKQCLWTTRFKRDPAQKFG